VETGTLGSVISAASCSELLFDFILSRVMEEGLLQVFHRFYILNYFDIKIFADKTSAPVVFP
jgi:hypothetical protein